MNIQLVCVKFIVLTFTINGFVHAMLSDDSSKPSSSTVADIETLPITSDSEAGNVGADKQLLDVASRDKTVEIKRNKTTGYKISEIGCTPFSGKNRNGGVDSKQHKRDVKATINMRKAYDIEFAFIDLGMDKGWPGSSNNIINTVDDWSEQAGFEKICFFTREEYDETLRNKVRDCYKNPRPVYTNKGFYPNPDGQICEYKENDESDLFEQAKDTLGITKDKDIMVFTIDETSQENSDRQSKTSSDLLSHVVFYILGFVPKTKSD